MPDFFNPFPGLRPFELEEDYLFFGREQQTAELLKLLRDKRFLSVIGTSGSGKSSLVRAGLLPELQRGVLNEAGSNWEVVVLRPGGDPLNNLATALQDADLYDPDDPEVLSHLNATLTHSGFGLVEAIRQSDVEPNTNVLIVVDQFEEIFRFRQMDAESAVQAASFVDLLLEATRQLEQPIYVVLTMRSDYLGDCTQFRGLTTAVNEGEYLIPRLTRDQIRTAIEGPVQVGGGEISFRLVQELLRSVGGNQDQLPILQHALMRTFDRWLEDREEDEPIDLRHYQDVGGMEEALSRHADEVFDSLESEDLQLVAEKLFKALTEQQSDNRGIRRPTRMDALGRIVGVGSDQIEPIVDAFRAPGVTFLMPPAETELLPETIVDISHESLMRVWRRLGRWVGDEAQSAQVYLRLADTAELHRADQAGLYRGPDLQIALAWMNEAQPTAAWGERYRPGFHLALEFLESSDAAGRADEIAAEEQRQRELEQAKALADAERKRAELQQKSVSRLRLLSGGVAIVALLAVFASVFAFQARTRALDAQQLARDERTRAVKKAEEAEVAEEKATVSAKEASLQQEKAEQARDTLNETLTRSHFLTATEHLKEGETEIGLAYLARSLRTDTSYWPAANQITSVLSEHNYLLGGSMTIDMEEPIQYAGLDRETRTFYWTATSGLKGALWNVRDRKKVGILADGARIDQPRFTKDASLLFLSLRDKGGSIQGFSTKDAKAATTLIPIKERVGRAFFVAEPLPKTLRIVADQPGTNHINIWDAVSGKVIGKELAFSKAPLARYVVTGDEKHVISAFQNKSIAIWKLEDASLVFKGKVAGPRISLNEDGRWIGLRSTTAKKSFDWIDLAAEKPSPKSLETEFFVDQCFFREGASEAALFGKIEKDLHCAVVDLTTAKITAKFSLKDYGGESMDIDFSRKNRDGYNSVGSWLAIIYKPGGTEIECRDLSTGKSVSTFDFSANPIDFFRLASDGLRMVTRHEDFSVRVWDIIDALPLIDPIPHTLSPQLVVSRDGERLFTVTLDDMKVNVWSSRTGKAIQEGHAFSQSFVSNLASLTDRGSMVQLNTTRFNSGSGVSLLFGQARAWQLVPKQRAFPTLEFPGGVRSVDFSPDGRLFAAQNARGLASVAKIWDAETLAEVRAFKLPQPGTISRFSPDSAIVAVGCQDGNVRVWNVNTGANQATIAVGGSVTDIQYTPDGKTLVTGTDSGRIQAFDAVTGYGLHDAWDIQAYQFEVDGYNGKRIAVGCQDGNQFLIELETGKITRLLPKALNTVSDVKFTPDGSTVLSIPFGGRIRAWDTETHELLFETPELDYYNTGAIHPDGNVIAVNASPRPDIKWGKVELWDWKNKTQVSEPLMSGGQSDRGRISFSHNGRLLACGNKQGGVVIWEWPSGAKILESSLPENSTISSIDFSSDDKRLAVSGFTRSTGTGTVTMIDLPPMDAKSPLWLAELAETVAQRRISENGDSVAVDRSGLSKLRSTIAESDPQSPYRQWGLWYFNSPTERTMSAWSRRPSSEHLADLLKSRDLVKLHKVLELDPNNGLAHAMIGYRNSVSARINNLKPHELPHWNEMIQWHSDQAIELDPAKADVWALRALVMQRVGRVADMEKAVNTALKLDADNIVALYARGLLQHGKGQAEMAFASFRTAYDKLPTARPPYDWQNGRPFLPGILDTLMRQRDRTPGSLATAGESRVAQTTGSVENRQLELDWLTRLAVEIYPKDPTVWQTRSKALLLAGRQDEALQALTKACDVGQDGSINPLRLGGLIRDAANRLTNQKKYAEAHQLLLTAGIPERSTKATARQVDLSKHYNQSLFDSVYREQKEATPQGFLWKELPVGLVTFNGIDFDLRGVIRLIGADNQSKQFLSPPPRRVDKIAVNQKATWIHVLHNCSFVFSVRHGLPLGRYLLHFEDGTEATLPIRYGQHLVTWANNPHATPTHAVFAWKEGDFNHAKTVVHCTWENPQPDKVIKAITFQSAVSSSSPFLYAISLESAAPPAGDRDTASLLAEARLKITMVNGATDVTTKHVSGLLKRALPGIQDNAGLKIRHAMASAETLKAQGRYADALKLLEDLVSDDRDVRNSLLKLRGRIHYAAGDLPKAVKMLSLSVDQEDYRVGKPLGLDHQLTERLFYRHAATKGKREARGFVLRSQIPPRQPGMPAEAINLTAKFNAGLHEAWHRQRDAALVQPPLYRTLRTGIHHFRGIPFDIRGAINLSPFLNTDIDFPSQVQNIAIGRKADQLHILNAGWQPSVTGTPAAVYRVFYADGKVENFVARYEIEIGDAWLAGTTDNIPNLVWRGEQAAAFNFKRDTALYMATWDNPRPDVEISHIDFTATLRRVNPLLVAITAESFAESLATEEADPRQLAARAVYNASRMNGSEKLLNHIQKLSKRATDRAPKDAEVWRLQAEMFLAVGNNDQASTSIEQALELDPESGAALYTKEKVLVRQGQTGEAIRTRSEARKKTLKGRVVPRDKELPAKYIDLTAHYNAALNEDPYLEATRQPYFSESFEALKPGLDDYAGVSFDVRGLIVLHGVQTELRQQVARLVNGVQGIPIGQSARAVHLLHGTSWGFRVPHGTVIGKYNFHYKDGSAQSVDIRYGEHLLDWFLRKKRTASEATLAHSHRSVQEADRQIGCYRMTWTNPKPDVPLSHIDFESYRTEASPFLLGITLDTGDSKKPGK